MQFVSDCLSVNGQGHLTIGGMDVPTLSRQYGTPLYLMDENAIRAACRSYTESLKTYYPGESLVAFAGKALCFLYLYKLLDEEGLGADVVSGGELHTAMKAGFPVEKMMFHGNYKTEAELRYALECNVGRFVIDNREEMKTLHELCKKTGKTAQVSFRLKPGIDAHTHEFVQTGKVDSKFGLAMETGEALATIKEALALPMLQVCGVNCHIGSQIFDPEPFSLAVEVLMRFMAEVKDMCGYEIADLNLGGGFGIRYIESHDPRPVAEVVKATAETVQACAKKFGLRLPRLILEPGRSIVGPAGITVYTVGSVKEIPNTCTYVAVDGGMTDNPRYALYGAAYDAVLPERPLAQREGPVTIAGRCCESGDMVAKDVKLPPVEAGDLLAVLATGAYNYSMASNYNRVPRPPIVMVRDGAEKLVVRRETYEDLVRNDVDC